MGNALESGKPYREENPIIIRPISEEEKTEIDDIVRELQAITPDSFLGRLFEYLDQRREEQRQRDSIEKPMHPLVVKIKQFMYSFPAF